VVTNTYIQSKTIITVLFLFLKLHRVPNKFWIFVGHGNVKDRPSVRRIRLRVPTVFTKPAETGFSFTSYCEDFNLQVFDDGFCSTSVPTANVTGGGWLEGERLVEQQTCVLRPFDSSLILAGLCSTCNSIISVPLFFPNAVWTAWGRKISLNWVCWWWRCLVKISSFTLPFWLCLQRLLGQYPVYWVFYFFEMFQKVEGKVVFLFHWLIWDGFRRTSPNCSWNDGFLDSSAHSFNSRPSPTSVPAVVWR